MATLLTFFLSFNLHIVTVGSVFHKVGDSLWASVAFRVMVALRNFGDVERKQLIKISETCTPDILNLK